MRDVTEAVNNLFSDDDDNNDDKIQICFALAFSCRTMWSGQNNGNQHGHVTARMETSLPMGTPSISVSQQQAPKKFAPVVAPKPKFNPYKPPGDAMHDIAGKTT